MNEQTGFRWAPRYRERLTVAIGKGAGRLGEGNEGVRSAGCWFQSGHGEVECSTGNIGGSIVLIMCGARGY